MINPIDLLPIPHPSEYEPEDRMFFYNNVVHPLIPDIIRIEENGIPIDLDQVQELEKQVTNILSEVQQKLATNPTMQTFLRSQAVKKKKHKTEQLETKRKTVKEFKKQFVVTNKIHRTYVINAYLDFLERPDLKLDEWSVKDVKKLNQIIASNFIKSILNADASLKTSVWVEKGMLQLATDKCNAYNKNHIDTKIENVQEDALMDEFNPASVIQLRNFFKFYEIESENTTPTGNPKWDRDEMLRVQKLLAVMLESKEKENIT